MECDERRAELTIEVLFRQAGELDSLNVSADANRRVALLAYGWWMRCVRTGEAIRLLHAAGLGQEASPLVRTLMHHELALKWLAAEPELAIEAVDYQHEVETNKVVSELHKRKWQIPDVGPLPKKPKGPSPEGMGLLHSFDALGDRVDRPNHYVPYRLESSYIHPSWLGASTYIDEDEVTAAVTLRSNSRVARCLDRLRPPGIMCGALRRVSRR
jgi:hypothetical protein